MDAHKLLSTQILSLASWMIEWSNEWNMKLKVALNNRMSVWVLPGVKREFKMTHWRGIYRQLTRIEPLEKSRQKSKQRRLIRRSSKVIVGLTDECKLPIWKTSRYNSSNLTDVSSV